MAFSGALTLTDLNDFITPSQVCIKPVEQVGGSGTAGEKEAGAAATEIHIDSAGAYYEVSNASPANGVKSTGGRKLEQAQISLNDCLACSGCITSAESVLITLQSHAEVFSFLDTNPGPSAAEHRVPVVSIAPQALASLAASLSPSSCGPPPTPRQVLRRVQVFCREVLGFTHVFDTTFARHIALEEHVREFEERRQGEGQLPMLASACPGWICYAEKAHGEMLPFIARTKSPQQVMGTLVKSWMGAKWGKLPHEIYHVCVMPCYDKKLEASRGDFYNEVYGTRDVDCVITTGELELMMRERGWDVGNAVAGEMEGEVEAEDGLPEMLEHVGTSSGSYLQAVVEHVRTTREEELVLDVKMMRNADYEEYTLGTYEGEVVFRGAKCYGFRNLQNVVRKVGREQGVRVGKGAAGRMGGRSVVKRGKEERGYDYVEVMACPGGCVNGGGQLRARGETDEEGYTREWEESGVMQAKWGDKAWTRRVEKAYWTGGNTERARADALVQRVRREMGESGQFRTTYRAVESEVVGLAVKW